MSLPEVLSEAVNCSDIRNPIELYDGGLVIDYPGKSIAGGGKLELSLTPDPDIRFTVQPNSPDVVPDVGDASLRIPDLGTTIPVIVTGAHVTSEAGATLLEGVPKGQVVVVGGENISSVIFHVTDFHDYFGHPIREKSGHHSWTGRLNLAAHDWEITIDAVSDLRERRNAATKYGGTPVTHTGKLERRGGEPFTGCDCGELLGLIQAFLSFVRGRWVAPLVATGFDRQGNRIWRDWTLWRSEKAPAVDSWCPVQDIKFVESLFPRFFQRWADPVWRELLRPAIGSYLQGNKQNWLDDSIIFAQIVLEMIADFVLVEQTRLRATTASGATNEDRLSLLFQHIPIPIDVPEQLAGLRRFMNSMGLSSGLAAMTCIRNACIHHNADGRRLTARLASEELAFYDASRLALWYADLCLLWLLGYEGRYQSRVHAKWAGETEAVPWEKPLEYLSLSESSPS
jgi:hypothetical protein